MDASERRALELIRDGDRVWTPHLEADPRLAADEVIVADIVEGLREREWIKAVREVTRHPGKAATQSGIGGN